MVTEKKCEIWDVGIEFQLKYDPFRESHRWTALSPEGRIGDYADALEALRAMDKWKPCTHKVIRGGMCLGCGQSIVRCTALDPKCWAQVNGGQCYCRYTQ